MRRLALALFLALFQLSASAASPDPNPELRARVAADQAARQSSAPRNWDEINAQDAKRRERVREMLRANEIRTATDFEAAALIFQHGQSVAEFRVAHSFAVLARNLNPESKRAKWLFAATWDRMLLSMNKPQWYGTQYSVSSKGLLELEEIDESAVSDADRVALGLPTLAEARPKGAK